MITTANSQNSTADPKTVAADSGCQTDFAPLKPTSSKKDKVEMRLEPPL
jgi:hypothetical protein